MSPTGFKDREILRELARKYVEVASLPVQQERRDLWTRHNDLQSTRVPILATYGMWNVWCRDLWGDGALECQDPLFRSHERSLRMGLFHHDVGDDFILEPWVEVAAVHDRPEASFWGVEGDVISAGAESGGWLARPVIQEWSDMAKLSSPPHKIREEESAQRFQQIQDTIGDILPVVLNRSAMGMGWMGDLSMNVARLRGLEQIMIDMFECPDDLRRLMAFLRDSIMANMQTAEKVGDVTLLSHQNQCMTYGGGLEAPQPSTQPRKISQMWGHIAAQELTLVSPEMHEEFMLNFQLPIIKQYGRIAYGCCEDLTRKIDMLRKVPNLRIIAVAPLADLAKCAEQIRQDYVLSWRPNPADMVCCGYDEGRITRILREGLQKTRGTRTHIHLKDIETVEGDYTRLAKWVRVARDVAASV